MKADTPRNVLRASLIKTRKATPLQMLIKNQILDGQNNVVEYKEKWEGSILNIQVDGRTYRIKKNGKLARNRILSNRTEALLTAGFIPGMFVGAFFAHEIIRIVLH